MNKVCSTCKTEKPVEDFDKSERGLHGRRSQCRSCQSAHKASKYAASEKLERLAIKEAYRAKETKICIRYNTEKSKNEYGNCKQNCDGLNNRCKPCMKIIRHEEYVKNPEKANTQAIQWKKDHPDRWKEYRRAFTPKHRKEHPDQLKAQGKVAYAVKKGELMAQPCEVCCDSTYTEAHHPSYEEENWLVIQWLCKRCHARANRMKTIPKVYTKELDAVWRYGVQAG